MIYQGPTKTENLIQKKFLLKIEQHENKIKEMDQWPNLCLATNVEDSSCSPMSFVNPLSFLSIYGIDDLSAATDEEITIAWDKFVADEQMFDNFADFYTPRSEIIETGKLLFIRSFIIFGAPLEIDGIRFND
jgi:hypothetical protein